MIRFLRKTFPHGVHPPEHKSSTCGLPIRRLAFAPELILPLSQHFGKPSVPLAQAGQEVVRGEPLARADGFMSVPLHAPATGTVERIDWMRTARGPKTESIVLKVHPGASQEVLYDHPREITGMNSVELITAIQDTGMVGLGGAAFPTHVKMKIPDSHKINTLLVNGCECEPYLTTDHRVMLEQTEDLIKGIRIAMRTVGAPRAIIGVEDNKKDAVDALESALPEGGDISVITVRTKYPQGAEKMLTKALLKREVPSNGYPSSIGVSIFNVATLAELGRLLPHSRGLIERVVTITGPGVKKPGNYLVALGTPMRFVLEQLGFHGGAGQLILGGPMMGATVASLDVPITKGVGGILVMTEGEAAKPVHKVHPCIKCSACLKACPIHLNPSFLGMLAHKRQYQTMVDRYHLFDCFECGSCSFVCPSGIPLVQYFRIAKTVIRDKAA